MDINNSQINNIIIKKFIRNKSHIKIDTSKSLDSNLSISDIDLPLYRYGLIHQIDINNYFNGYNQINKQCIKSYLIVLFFIFHILKFIVCIKDFIIYGIISIILYILLSFLIVKILYYSFEYFYIICYYCKIRVKCLCNQMVLNSEHLLLNYKSIDKIIRGHNKICQTIFKYNLFWKYY